MFRFKRLSIVLVTVLFFVATAYAAVTLTASNEFKYEKGRGTVDLPSDTCKVILMGSGFVFDPDTDGTYSDISADEIDSSGGYVVGGYNLTVDSAWAQDNANDRARIAWVDYTFTASGDAFDTFCAATVLDYSFATANPLVIGCIEFGQDIDVADGQSFQLQNIAYSSN